MFILNQFQTVHNLVPSCIYNLTAFKVQYDNSQVQSFYFSINLL